MEGSLSLHKIAGKSKKSPTAHLHPPLSSYAPPQPENENSLMEQPQDEGGHPQKNLKVFDVVRSNPRRRKGHKELTSGKQEADTRALASEANNAKTRQVSNATIKSLVE